MTALGHAHAGPRSCWATLMLGHAHAGPMTSRVILFPTTGVDGILHVFALMPLTRCSECIVGWSRLFARFPYSVTNLKDSSL